MKLFNLLPVVCMSAIFCISCNDEKKDGDTATATTTEETTTSTVVTKAGEGKRTTITVDKVPAPVVTTFQTKAPKAAEVQWVSYDPVPADNWDLEKDYYFVTYRLNNVPYEAWISPEGEFIRSEPVIHLDNSGDLPKEVVKAIMENYPGYAIAEIEKENEDKTTNYEVHLTKDGNKVKVRYAPDGTVLKEKTK
jgi:Putative beta-lactamase-inhibitor-like, PepSY-like